MVVSVGVAVSILKRTGDVEPAMSDLNLKAAIAALKPAMNRVTPPLLGEKGREAVVQAALFEADDGDGLYSLEERRKAAGKLEDLHRSYAQVCGDQTACLSRKIHDAKAAQKVRGGLNGVLTPATAELVEVHVVDLSPIEVKGVVPTPLSIVIPRAPLPGLAEPMGQLDENTVRSAFQTGP